MTGPVQAGPPVVFGAGVRVGAAAYVLDEDHPGGALTVVSGAPQIDDVEIAPIGAPVALIRGTDGLFRPDVATGSKAAWSDPIRFRPGIPTDDPAAPEGAVQIDTTSGRVYRRKEQ